MQKSIIGGAMALLASMGNAFGDKQALKELTQLKAQVKVRKANRHIPRSRVAGPHRPAGSKVIKKMKNGTCGLRHPV